MDALQGRDFSSGGWAHVQAPLHFHRAIQCRLHASACMAHGRLPCRVRGQAKFILTPFVNLSEMSDLLPVAVQHPILLDVATREAMMKTGEPMAPLHLRGFRLHTVWTQQPGEEVAHQVAFPHFLGEAMLECEPERVPQDLTQGQKMAVNLRPPSSNHWNIVSDLVFPLTIDTF